MTAVQLRNVQKSYGTFRALQNINIDIGTGEFVAILGPSGCGKTTTLRLIAGLEALSSGQILFDGMDVSQLSVQARNVGMVFQRFALFPHMSVEKNIAFGLSVRRTDPVNTARKIAEILDVVQLTPFRHRFPAQLSGGQMQRVAIARTLVTQPSVLMLDEPLANLDTKLRSEMRRFIKALQRRYAITTLFVTHDQIEAMELSDRVCVILGGCIAQYDTPSAIYRRPRSRAVAEFMGAANLFPARFVGQDRVETEFGLLPVACCPHNSIQRASPDGSLYAMVRSEAIDIATSAHKDLTTRLEPHCSLGGRIVTRDFFGSSVSYTVAIGAASLVACQPARSLIDVGTPVQVRILPEHVWLMNS